MKIFLLCAVPLLSVVIFTKCAEGEGGAISAMPADVSMKVKDMPVAYDNPGIFKKYNAQGDSVMNDTWTRKFDASGISFDVTQACTLVTEQHVVMAAHYQRKVPSPVIFHDRTGKRLERVLVSARNVHGDCAVGLLNEPVPAGYKAYPLLEPEEGLAEKLIDEFVIVTDQDKRLFVHEVAGISGDRIGFKFDAAKGIGYGKILISGDSGHPSFIMVNGEPVLIETHHTGGPGAGPFFGSAVLIDNLKAQIKALGGKGSVRLVKFE